MGMQVFLDGGFKLRESIKCPPKKRLCRRRAVREETHIYWPTARDIGAGLFRWWNDDSYWRCLRGYMPRCSLLLVSLTCHETDTRTQDAEDKTAKECHEGHMVAA